MPESLTKHDKRSVIQVSLNLIAGFFYIQGIMPGIKLTLQFRLKMKLSLAVII